MAKFVCQVTFEIPDEVIKDFEQNFEDCEGDTVTLEEIFNFDGTIALHAYDWVGDLEQYICVKPDFIKMIKE